MVGESEEDERVGPEPSGMGNLERTVKRREVGRGRHTTRRYGTVGSEESNESRPATRSRVAALTLQSWRGTRGER